MKTEQIIVLQGLCDEHAEPFFSVAQPCFSFTSFPNSTVYSLSEVLGKSWETLHLSQSFYYKTHKYYILYLT